MVSIPNKDDSSRGKVATLMQEIDDQRERECWTAQSTPSTFNTFRMAKPAQLPRISRNSAAPLVGITFALHRTLP